MRFIAAGIGGLAIWVLAQTGCSDISGGGEVDAGGTQAGGASGAAGDLDPSEGGSSGSGRDLGAGAPPEGTDSGGTENGGAATGGARHDDGEAGQSSDAAGSGGTLEANGGSPHGGTGESAGGSGTTGSAGTSDGTGGADVSQGGHAGGGMGGESNEPECNRACVPVSEACGSHDDCAVNQYCDGHCREAASLGQPYSPGARCAGILYCANTGVCSQPLGYSELCLETNIPCPRGTTRSGGGTAR